jgi:hypothetical protein
MPRRPKPEKPPAEVLVPIPAEILDQLVREGPLTVPFRSRVRLR